MLLGASQEAKLSGCEISNYTLGKNIEECDFLQDLDICSHKYFMIELLEHTNM